MSAFCRLCKGGLELLGILGRVEWVQCKACGYKEGRKIEVLREDNDNVTNA